MKTQYAALPYRFGVAGKLEILLMTSRRSRRWIIPKGWPITGLSPEKTAEREAFEEAGIVGKVDTAPIGRFCYRKLMEKANRVVDCEVTVFPMRVADQLTTWPEAGQRELRWLPARAAAELVDDVGLSEIIDSAASHIADPGSRRSGRSSRGYRLGSKPDGLTGNKLLQRLGEALANAVLKPGARQR